MNTSSRKQREIQEREQRILDLARRMFNEHGYHGLNMDKIAEQLQYSKGTIYNHFGCKEEIIIALAIETSNVLLELFQRAASFQGSSRERMAAIALAFEIFVRLHSSHFLLVQILRSDSIRQKTSEKRQSVMRTCELRSTGIVAGIVRDAVSSTDLALPPETAPEDVVFGLWALNYGAYAIITTSDSLKEIGMNDPFEVVRRQAETLMDGYPWHPISSEHNYEASREKIAHEIFPHEFKRIHQVTSH